MTNDEIITMCDRLAYKYNSVSHKEDLKMEGILTCYEILAEEPEAHPAKLFREAKRRMHDYLNLDTQPVTIPNHSRSRRLTRNIEDDNSGDMSEQGYDWLKSVLSSSNVAYDEDFGMSDFDHVAAYEDKEYYTYVKGVVLETLSPTELSIINLRYYEDMTQDEVAERLGYHQTWVSRTETSALHKLETELCNNS